MNAKQLTAAVLVAFAGTAAFAQEATSDAWMHVPSTQSRAEVKSQVLQARTNGTLLNDGEITRVAEPKATSLRTRADVRAEARATPNRFDGELSQNAGE